VPSPAEAVVAALAGAADAERAVAMARYMKDRFPFYGVPSPPRRALQRAALGGWRPSGTDELTAVARALWAVPEREAQYVACDVVRRWWKLATLELCEELITTRAWWDTVDAVVPVVGDLVRRDPELVAVMDRWVDDADRWRARTAILHQLRFKADTDVDRLFAYCTARAADAEFFIRKAIGWALRQYAWTDPEAVRAYVAAHPELSGLSRREALRNADIDRPADRGPAGAASRRPAGAVPRDPAGGAAPQNDFKTPAGGEQPRPKSPDGAEPASSF
jgi:3-methyladenine DNA glycosylase AlkD